MDQLWDVAAVVLTPSEIATLTPSETFVLVSAFYVHDLGMSVAATEEGRRSVESTPEFRAHLEHLGEHHDSGAGLALMLASRDVHARLAAQLATEPLPGLGRHLISSPELRQEWADLIGQVSASHHWSLPTLDAKLGRRGVVPGPRAGAGTIDVAYVASLLRIIDYAHINSSRAKRVERKLRISISAASAVHWDAQEQILGPSRAEDRLVYASQMPLETADAWWMFYELARGLHAEIESVSEYLESRAASVGRFSLRGVKGVSSARDFSALVQTKGFEPVDIRFKPDSMERLVGLLGGRSLYGDDAFAPLRELLQNATDAVRLRRALADSQGLERSDGSVQIRLGSDETGPYLSVTDTGVGMSERVITNYLLGVASDYWNSADYFADFAGARDRGFKPIGRFGIGFLSVFMLGDEIAVETQRFVGGESLRLTLRGVGGRGSLQRLPPRLQSGTSVSARLNSQAAAEHVEVHRVVQRKAPMLDVRVVTTESGIATSLEPGWWKEISQEALAQFLLGQSPRARTGRPGWARFQLPDEVSWLYEHDGFSSLSDINKWPGRQPEIISSSYRVMAIPGQSRVLLCSKGFSVTWVPLPGLIGMVDVPDLVLTASRHRVLEWDSSAFRDSLMHQLAPEISTALERLNDEGSIVSRYDFLVSAAKAYGAEILANTALKWISVLRSPGHMALMSPAELEALLRERPLNAVGVGYNLGPWSIYSAIRRHYPDAPKDMVLIAVSSSGQTSVRPGETYDERKHELRGPLEDHFQSERSDVPRAILLDLVVNIVARAWQRDVADLRSTAWASVEKELCGYLQK